MHGITCRRGGIGRLLFFLGVERLLDHGHTNGMVVKKTGNSCVRLDKTRIL